MNESVSRPVWETLPGECQRGLVRTLGQMAMRQIRSASTAQQTSIGQMSIGQMSIGQMSIGQMSIGQMSIGGTADDDRGGSHGAPARRFVREDLSPAP